MSHSIFNTFILNLTKNIDKIYSYIAKHIPTVADAVKEGTSKAIDFVRLHPKETFIISGIFVVGCTIAGTVSYVAHHKQRKLNRQFGLALQEYLASAHNGTLSIDILSTLINSIEVIKKTIQRSLLISIFLQLNSMT